MKFSTLLKKNTYTIYLYKKRVVVVVVSVEMWKGKMYTNTVRHV